MGFNTSVIVINDALTEIENDPEFGKKLSEAVKIASWLPSHRDPIDFVVRAGNHCNAASVIETHHADITTLVSFGGNMGVEQLSTYGYMHHEPAMQLRMCEQWADKLGYRLVKRAAKLPKVG